MDMYNAIAEPTRRTIIEILAKNGELSAGEIYTQFSSTNAAISQHLKVLREANLVKVEKKAQQRMYKINPAPFVQMQDWIIQTTKLWNKRFDALEKVIETEKRKLNK